MGRRVFAAVVVAALMSVGLAVPAAAVDLATLSGVVRGPGDLAVAGASVALIDSSTREAVALTTSDSSGHYSASVPGGVYDIAAGGPPGSQLGATVLGVVVVDVTTLDVALADTQVDSVFRVVGSDGVSFGADLRVDLFGPGAYNGLFTDADGQVARSVVPGLYFGEVSGPLGPDASVRARLRDIAAVDGDVPIVLPARRLLTVNLVNPDGSPASADRLDLSCFASQDSGGLSSAYPQVFEVSGGGFVAPASGTVVVPGLALVSGCRVIVARDGVSAFFPVPADRSEVTGVSIGGTWVFAYGSFGATTDGDNVSDVVESLAPNSGDGNGDTIPDADQNNVTSLPILGGTVGSEPFVTLASDPGTTLTNVRTIDANDPSQVSSPPPPGVSVPEGLLAFSVSGLTPGSDQYVTIYTSDTSGINGYAKYQSSTGTWSLLPSDRVEVLADRVVIRLTDGGVGDDDGLANGVIVDPGALAVVADSTPPSVALDGVTAGGSYTLGAVPTATCSASDAESGRAGPCTVTVTGGNANGVGTFTVTAAATDRIGNVGSVSATYRVIYRFDGFEQPINDPTAGATALSVFKKGSTVPVRFRLLNAAGQVVAPTSAPLWTTPQQGSALSASVNEPVYSEAPSTTDSFTLTGSTWSYGWSTKGVAAGYRYRIGVRLDDGTTRYVVVGVR